MALTVNYPKYGTTFTGAYIRISNLNYSNGKTQVWQTNEETGEEELVETKVLHADYVYQVFADADSSEVIHSEMCHITLATADDVLGDCYTDLKTREGFESAVDA